MQIWVARSKLVALIKPAFRHIICKLTIKPLFVAITKSEPRNPVSSGQLAQLKLMAKLSLLTVCANPFNEWAPFGCFKWGIEMNFWVAHEESILLCLPKCLALALSMMMMAKAIKVQLYEFQLKRQQQQQQQKHIKLVREAQLVNVGPPKRTSSCY